MGELRDKEPLPSRPFSKSVLAVGWVAHSLKIYQVTSDMASDLWSRTRPWTRVVMERFGRLMTMLADSRSGGALCVVSAENLLCWYMVAGTVVFEPR